MSSSTEEIIRFRQRKYLVLADFKFLPARLRYRFIGLRREQHLTVDYREISPVTRRGSSRYAGYLWTGLAFLAVAAILWAFLGDNSQALYPALLGLLMLIAYVLDPRRDVVCSTGDAELVVFGGNKQQAILDEITRRRKELFLGTLRTNEYVTDLEKRDALISRLLDRGIISSLEASGLALEPPAPVQHDGSINVAAPISPLLESASAALSRSEVAVRLIDSAIVLLLDQQAYLPAMTAGLGANEVLAASLPDNKITLAKWETVYSTRLDIPRDLLSSAFLQADDHVLHRWQTLSGDATLTINCEIQAAAAILRALVKLLLNDGTMPSEGPRYIKWLAQNSNRLAPESA